jgi:hypothetical protein
MQTMIDGATAVLTVQALDDAGAAQTISAWTVTAAWHAGSTVAPTTPVCTSTDSTTWLVVASSAGLGGRSCTLRVTVTDPVSGRVLVADEQYLIKA